LLNNAPFLILAAVTLVGAGAAMMLRSLVHCALALAVAFAGIGMLYLHLGAQFIGLAQMLVYVGAIAVLIVFVILLTRGDDAEPPAKHSLTGSFLALAVFAVLAWAVFHSSYVRSPTAVIPQTTIRELGFALMDHYIFPLEVIGLMLTAALIGAVIVAMKEKPGPQ
jgi:NADH-quinone oxidoreductase subunit J